ncbi:sulfur carrier protein ThiS [Methylobacterium organophilum]|uniref:Sulfur carrier protein ThiS n=1 Tax=Methylobacterium organophilum TaxID=410 RepID=A0ABQ4TD82_METOR|nr:sulfur carrier protein ThiS [Methylobacterium organophilum]UMY18265.1 sulfur carrier protein ThiS [Methylobacterium organophilum]GJE28075.1 Sulfur carrier protein ThiS [Methylobacterium organophilum]
MTVTINGERREHAAETLASLFAVEAEERGIESPEGIAMALNGRVVRRSEWSVTPLRDGDRVEIVRAMQGG